MKCAFALAAFACAAAACAPALRDHDRSEVIGRILASTVQLRSERDAGVRRAASGVVVATDPGSRRAWIVTARHFVDPPAQQEVYVRLPGRTSVTRAEIAFVSPEHDLAVITAGPLDVTPVHLKELASLGEEIMIVAFPWGRRFTVVAGVVSQIAAPEGQVLLVGPVRMVDASVSYGSSGGGVFDARSGELIGVVEGHRTAKVTVPAMRDRPLEVPVAGETTVVATPAILRILEDAGLGRFVQR